MFDILKEINFFAETQKIDVFMLNMDVFFCNFFSSVSFCDAPRMWQIFFQDPATVAMEGIIDFHHDLTFIIVILSIFVSYIMFVTIFFFNVHNQKRFSAKLVHNSVLEIVWTVIPAVILMLIATPSFALLYGVDEIVDPIITIKAIGHQWYWHYEYGDHSLGNKIFSEDHRLVNWGLRLLETNKRVVIPKGIHIRLLTSSVDVLHSWAVPSLGIKIDSCPGRLNQASLFAARQGVFFGACSEICGINHAFMPIVVETTTLTQYLGWLGQSMGVTLTPSGKNVIVTHLENCIFSLVRKCEESALVPSDVKLQGTSNKTWKFLFEVNSSSWPRIFLTETFGSTFAQSKLNITQERNSWVKVFNLWKSTLFNTTVSNSLFNGFYKSAAVIYCRWRYNSRNLLSGNVSPLIWGSFIEWTYPVFGNFAKNFRGSFNLLFLEKVSSYWKGRTDVLKEFNLPNIKLFFSIINSKIDWSRTVYSFYKIFIKEYFNYSSTFLFREFIIRSIDGKHLAILGFRLRNLFLNLGDLKLFNDNSIFSINHKTKRLNVMVAEKKLRIQNYHDELKKMKSFHFFNQIISFVKKQRYLNPISKLNNYHIWSKFTQDFFYKSFIFSSFKEKNGDVLGYTFFQGDFLYFDWSRFIGLTSHLNKKDKISLDLWKLYETSWVQSGDEIYQRVSGKLERLKKKKFLKFKGWFRYTSLDARIRKYLHNYPPVFNFEKGRERYYFFYRQVNFVLREVYGIYPWIPTGDWFCKNKLPLISSEFWKSTFLDEGRKVTHKRRLFFVLLKMNRIMERGLKKWLLHLVGTNKVKPMTIWVLMQFTREHNLDPRWIIWSLLTGSILTSKNFSERELSSIDFFQENLADQDKIVNSSKYHFYDAWKRSLFLNKEVSTKVAFSHFYSDRVIGFIDTLQRIRLRIKNFLNWKPFFFSFDNVLGHGFNACAKIAYSIRSYLVSCFYLSSQLTTERTTIGEIYNVPHLVLKFIWKNLTSSIKFLVNKCYLFFYKINIFAGSSYVRYRWLNWSRANCSIDSNLCFLADPEADPEKLPFYETWFRYNSSGTFNTQGKKHKNWVKSISSFFFTNRPVFSVTWGDLIKSWISSFLPSLSLYWEAAGGFRYNERFKLFKFKNKDTKDPLTLQFNKISFDDRENVDSTIGCNMEDLDFFINPFLQISDSNIEVSGPEFLWKNFFDGGTFIDVNRFSLDYATIPINFYNIDNQWDCWIPNRFFNDYDFSKSYWRLNNNFRFYRNARAHKFIFPKESLGLGEVEITAVNNLVDLVFEAGFKYYEEYAKELSLKKDISVRDLSEKILNNMDAPNKSIIKLLKKEVKVDFFNNLMGMILLLKKKVKVGSLNNSSNPCKIFLDFFMEYWLAFYAKFSFYTHSWENMDSIFEMPFVFISPGRVAPWRNNLHFFFFLYNWSHTKWEEQLPWETSYYKKKKSYSFSYKKRGVNIYHLFNQYYYYFTEFFKRDDASFKAEQAFFNQKTTFYRNFNDSFRFFEESDVSFSKNVMGDIKELLISLYLKGYKQYCSMYYDFNGIGDNSIYKHMQLYYELNDYYNLLYQNIYELLFDNYLISYQKSVKSFNLDVSDFFLKIGADAYVTFYLSSKKMMPGWSVNHLFSIGKLPAYYLKDLSNCYDAQLSGIENNGYDCVASNEKCLGGARFYYFDGDFKNLTKVSLTKFLDFVSSINSLNNLSVEVFYSTKFINLILDTPNDFIFPLSMVSELITYPDIYLDDMQFLNGVLGLDFNKELHTEMCDHRRILGEWLKLEFALKSNNFIRCETPFIGMVINDGYQAIIDLFDRITDVYIKYLNDKYLDGCLLYQLLENFYEDYVYLLDCVERVDSANQAFSFFDMALHTYDSFRDKINEIFSQFENNESFMWERSVIGAPDFREEQKNPFYKPLILMMESDAGGRPRGRARFWRPSEARAALDRENSEVRRLIPSRAFIQVQTQLRQARARMEALERQARAARARRTRRAWSRRRGQGGVQIQNQDFYGQGGVQLQYPNALNPDYYRHFRAQQALYPDVYRRFRVRNQDFYQGAVNPAWFQPQYALNPDDYRRFRAQQALYPDDPRRWNFIGSEPVDEIDREPEDEIDRLSGVLALQRQRQRQSQLPSWDQARRARRRARAWAQIQNQANRGFYIEALISEDPIWFQDLIRRAWLQARQDERAWLQARQDEVNRLEGRLVTWFQRVDVREFAAQANRARADAQANRDFNVEAWLQDTETHAWFRDLVRRARNRRINAAPVNPVINAAQANPVGGADSRRRDVRFVPCALEPMWNEVINERIKTVRTELKIWFQLKYNILRSLSFSLFKFSDNYFSFLYNRVLKSYLRKNNNLLVSNDILTSLSTSSALNNVSEISNFNFYSVLIGDDFNALVPIESNIDSNYANTGLYFNKYLGTVEYKIKDSDAISFLDSRQNVFAIMLKNFYSNFYDKWMPELKFLNDSYFQDLTNIWAKSPYIYGPYNSNETYFLRIRTDSKDLRYSGENQILFPDLNTLSCTSVISANIRPLTWLWTLKDVTNLDFLNGFDLYYLKRGNNPVVQEKLRFHRHYARKLILQTLKMPSSAKWRKQYAEYNFFRRFAKYIVMLDQKKDYESLKYLKDLFARYRGYSVYWFYIKVLLDKRFSEKVRSKTNWLVSNPDWVGSNFNISGYDKLTNIIRPIEELYPGFKVALKKQKIQKATISAKNKLSEIRLVFNINDFSTVKSYYWNFLSSVGYVIKSLFFHPDPGALSNQSWSLWLQSFFINIDNPELSLFYQLLTNPKQNRNFWGFFGDLFDFPGSPWNVRPTASFNQDWMSWLRSWFWFQDFGKIFYKLRWGLFTYFEGYEPSIESWWDYFWNYQIIFNKIEKNLKSSFFLQNFSFYKWFRLCFFNGDLFGKFKVAIRYFISLLRDDYNTYFRNSFISFFSLIQNKKGLYLNRLLLNQKIVRNTDSFLSQVKKLDKLEDVASSISLSRGQTVKGIYVIDFNFLKPSSRSWYLWFKSWFFNEVDMPVHIVNNLIDLIRYLKLNQPKIKFTIDWEPLKCFLNLYGSEKNNFWDIVFKPINFIISDFNTVSSDVGFNVNYNKFLFNLKKGEEFKSLDLILKNDFLWSWSIRSIVRSLFRDSGKYSTFWWSKKDWFYLFPTVYYRHPIKKIEIEKVNDYSRKDWLHLPFYMVALIELLHPKNEPMKQFLDWFDYSENGGSLKWLFIFLTRYSNYSHIYRWKKWFFHRTTYGLTDYYKVAFDIFQPYYYITSFGNPNFYNKNENFKVYKCLSFASSWFKFFVNSNWFKSRIKSFENLAQGVFIWKNIVYYEFSNFNPLFPEPSIVADEDLNLVNKFKISPVVITEYDFDDKTPKSNPVLLYTRAIYYIDKVRAYRFFDPRFYEYISCCKTTIYSDDLLVNILKSFYQLDLDYKRFIFSISNFDLSTYINNLSPFWFNFSFFVQKEKVLFNSSVIDFKRKDQSVSFYQNGYWIDDGKLDNLNKYTYAIDYLKSMRRAFSPEVLIFIYQRLNYLQKISSKELNFDVLQWYKYQRRYHHKELPLTTYSLQDNNVAALRQNAEHRYKYGVNFLQYTSNWNFNLRTTWKRPQIAAVKFFKDYDAFNFLLLSYLRVYFEVKPGMRKWFVDYLLERQQKEKDRAIGLRLGKNLLNFFGQFSHYFIRYHGVKKEKFTTISFKSSLYMDPVNHNSLARDLNFAYGKNVIKGEIDKNFSINDFFAAPLKKKRKPLNDFFSLRGHKLIKDKKFSDLFQWKFNKKNVSPYKKKFRDDFISRNVNEKNTPKSYFRKVFFNLANLYIPFSNSREYRSVDDYLKGYNNRFFFNKSLEFVRAPINFDLSDVSFSERYFWSFNGPFLDGDFYIKKWKIFYNSAIFYLFYYFCGNVSWLNSIISYQIFFFEKYGLSSFFTWDIYNIYYFYRPCLNLEFNYFFDSIFGNFFPSFYNLDFRYKLNIFMDFNNLLFKTRGSFIDIYSDCFCYSYTFDYLNSILSSWSESMTLLKDSFSSLLFDFRPECHIYYFGRNPKNLKKNAKFLASQNLYSNNLIKNPYLVHRSFKNKK